MACIGMHAGVVVGDFCLLGVVVRSLLAIGVGDVDFGGIGVLGLMRRLVFTHFDITMILQ